MKVKRSEPFELRGEGILFHSLLPEQLQHLIENYSKEDTWTEEVQVVLATNTHTHSVNIRKREYFSGAE